MTEQYNQSEVCTLYEIFPHSLTCDHAWHASGLALLFFCLQDFFAPIEKWPYMHRRGRIEIPAFTEERINRIHRFRTKEGFCV